jgi:hypothetical protein
MNRNFSGTLRAAGLVFAIAASLLGSVGTSTAQDFTPEQRAACTPDAFRLCASDMPNVPAITACMRKNRASLSPACKAVFPR